MRKKKEEGGEREEGRNGGGGEGGEINITIPSHPCFKYKDQKKLKKEGGRGRGAGKFISNRDETAREVEVEVDEGRRDGGDRLVELNLFPKERRLRVGGRASTGWLNQSP